VNYRSVIAALRFPELGLDRRPSKPLMNARLGLHLLALCTVVAASSLLSACSSAAKPPTNLYISTETLRGASSLYVLNVNQISIYKHGEVQPSRSIVTGISAPVAMTLDRSGNVYVANNGDGTNTGSVVEYQSGTDTIIRTITDGAARPHSLAVDRSGRLYVGNGDTNTYSVNVYAPGQTAPALSITTYDTPRALIVNPASTLYVLGAVVTVYATHSGAPERQIKAGVLEPTAFSFSQDQLFVANCGRECNNGQGNLGTVTSYDAKTGKLLNTLKKGITGPGTLTFANGGTLFVADYLQPQKRTKGIVVFEKGAKSPSETITDGVDSPVALICDQQRNLYVANIHSSTISEYAEGATSPERTITIGLKNPYALAFGP
jgi:DNA-binding beta-propeller fold protein YncE